MAKSEKKKPPVHIEAFKYKDRRANIPTEELRDFVVKDEASPKTILYPRDPSLDPQLVWKGKDEQDSKDLEVPAVPFFFKQWGGVKKKKTGRLLDGRTWDELPGILRPSLATATT